jgi:hypothetical protein
MITFELVSKKRKPIKRNAFISMVIGILLLALVGFSGHLLGHAVKVVIMIVVAGIFVTGLYIINYSAMFKNTIGQISFYENYIEIVTGQKKEIIYIDNIRNIRFKLNGYEGLNNSTLFEYLVWRPVVFSYHNGMNNFVTIYTSGGPRQFEFYIPDRRRLLEAKKMAQEYFHLVKK